jgi:transcriptional regulator with XRE-family HTH domain
MRYDYAIIAGEFLRALRGRRSQAAFSRRLGYRTNMAYVWEAGRAFPTAANTLAAARRVGIDVSAALRRFYKAPPPWLDTIDPSTSEGVARLIEDLRGRTSIVDLARAAGKSRFAVARWLRGEAEPRLPDFLLLIEKSSLRLLDWLAAFVDPDSMPSLSRAWAELEASRRAAYDVPWTQAVLRALELTGYRSLRKHEPGWIAARIGISLDDERHCLSLLARTGQISLRHGRWELRQVRTVDTRRDAAAEHRVKRWWAELALERLQAPESGLFSYNVFAVSDADFARIQELQLAYFRQMRAIIAESEPSERIVLASQQLVALDSSPAADP